MLVKFTEIVVTYRGNEKEVTKRPIALEASNIIAIVGNTKIGTRGIQSITWWDVEESYEECLKAINEMKLISSDLSEQQTTIINEIKKSGGLFL